MFNSKEISKQLNSKFKTSFNETAIEEVLNSIFPVNSENGKYTLHYINSRLDKSNYHVPNPAILLATAPLYALFRLENKTTNEFTETEVFLGEFPSFY